MEYINEVEKEYFQENYVVDVSLAQGLENP